MEQTDIKDSILSDAIETAINQQKEIIALKRVIWLLSGVIVALFLHQCL